MASIVIGFKTPTGTTVEIDPAKYDSPEAFAEEVKALGTVGQDAQILVKGKKPFFHRRSFPSKYPEIGWYLADYSKSYDPDAVIAAFAASRNLEHPHGLTADMGPRIKAVRWYKNPNVLVDFWMKAHPEHKFLLKTRYKDDLVTEVVSNLRGTAVGFKPLVVSWVPGSEPTKWTAYSPLPGKTF